MKKLLLILTIINFQSLIFTLMAQTPQAIPYQAVARNNAGGLIVNQAISLRFTIHDLTANGAIVYRETQNKTTNTNGLFTANVGQGTVVNGTFSSIDWTLGSKFMQVEIDITGGIVYTDMGTQQMLSVPYALYSLKTGDGKHFIGEVYGGGIVFYVYDNGQHGLIASTADQNPSIQWYNDTYRYTGTLGSGLGAGVMNTAMIIAAQMADNQPGNFAAKVCADYSVVVGGITYGDWYLPSKYELNLLFLQKNIVGGFASGGYWSSTEDSNNQAWYQTFNIGNQNADFKANQYKVRAVRAF